MTVPMDTVRWQRLSALFDQAADLDPGDWPAFLARECAGDPDLRATLERMLAADAATAVAFDGGAPAMVAIDAAADVDVVAETDRVGTRVGPWRLEQVLGRGGMGTVYAARRDDADTLQRAAVKCLQRRWDGSGQAQRFLLERRILAALAHPHIPHLLDHGVDGDGRPWFALEYVDGAPINEWADARQLSPAQRIAVFRDVCSAVQYAHEHFVVHRDLKPGNVLVDADGRAKVLDFGVAKRLDEDLPSTTRTGLMAGFTPEYAAPEQVSGGRITAATDVYALGVMLYQLLAGRLPYRLDHADLRQATDAIVHSRAPRLDQALTSGSADDVAARLAARATDVGTYRRFVRGDLDRILQTALAKEPERRYRSVRDFNEDLRRFLEGWPVSVTGDTPAYRARKFVSRNRGLAAMALVAVLAIGGGVAGVLVKAREAQREAVRATAEATRANAEAARAQREVERVSETNEFLRSIFAGANLTSGHSPNMTLEAALDEAVKSFERDSAQDPRLQVRALLAASSSYEAMGRADKSDAAVRRALAIQESKIPQDKEERAMVLSALAWMQVNQAPKQALAWARESYGILKARLPANDAAFREILSVLSTAQYFNDDIPGALATTHEARDYMLSRGVAPDNQDVLTMYSNEAIMLVAAKRFDEAYAVSESVIKLRGKASSPDSASVAYERNTYGLILNMGHRWARALAQFDQAAGALAKALPPDSDIRQLLGFGRGQALVELGRPAEALAGLAGAHAYGRGSEFSARQAGVAYYYARALAETGDCKGAAAVLAEMAKRKIDLAKQGDPLAKSHCPAA